MTFPQYVLQVSRGFTGHLGAVVGLIPPDGVPGPWFLEAVWRPRVVAFRLKGILDPRHIVSRRRGLPGEVLQDAMTDALVFPVRPLIAILSACMTLEPGDVVVTGTPAGVGYARKPPIWMKAGDTVEIEVPGIGKLVNTIRDE